MTLNPVSYARMSAGLTKTALSNKLSVSRTFIIRAEQGCYETPGNKLGSFTTKTLNIGRETLQERYENFQYEKRTGEVEFRGPLLLGAEVVLNQADHLPDSHTPVEIYPHLIFKKWREAYWNTIIGFSGSMCVHPSSVEQYESGKYKSMPIQLKDALESMNLIAPGFKVNERWFYGTYKDAA